ncbi:MAG: hypothetical protein ACOC00_05700 [Halothiobacillaceae bacterium]
MRVLAIDPGLSGAIALLDTESGASVWDMPTIGRGKAGRRRVNAAELCSLIAGCHADVGVIEQVGSRPGQGVSSTFAFGEAYGTARTAIIAAGLPIEHVGPRQWKGMLGLGRCKEASRTRAVELFPELCQQLARKRDEGRAEALLIATWYVRTREAMRSGDACGA